MKTTEEKKTYLENLENEELLNMYANYVTKNDWGTYYDDINLMTLEILKRMRK